MGRGADNERLFYGKDLDSLHSAEDIEMEASARRRLEILSEAMNKNEEQWDDCFPLTIAFSKLVKVDGDDCAINVSMETDGKGDWALVSSIIRSHSGHIDETNLYRGKDLALALEAANNKSKEIAPLQEDPSIEAFSWGLDEAILSIDRLTDEELENAKRQ